MPKHISAWGLFPIGLLAFPLLRGDGPASAPQTAPRPSSTVSVTGTGRIDLEPDLAEIVLRVRARDETIDTALDEFNARRALFDKVVADFSDLEATASGQGVRMGRPQQTNNVVRFNGEEPAAAPFEAVEVLDVRFPMGDDPGVALERVAQLVAAMDEVDCEIDAPDPNSRVYYPNRDAEPAGPIRFVVSEERFEAARRRSMELAFADARRRAEHLAQLAGRRLGEVRTMAVRKELEREVSSSGGGEREASLSVTFELID